MMDSTPVSGEYFMMQEQMKHTQLGMELDLIY